MKFGHLYREFLEEGGFPSHWIETSISYNQLKKCIKSVKQELASLGLDAVTLQRLLGSVENSAGTSKGLNTSGESEDERPVRYEFTDPGATTPNGNSMSSRGPVRPKLLVLVDEETGEPLDARLAPETRNYIHQLTLNERLVNVRITGIDGESLEKQGTEHSSTTETSSPDVDWDRRSSRSQRLIEVPLTNDSVFFTLLQDQLSSLASLQDEEKKKLHSRISDVGKTLALVTNPSDSKAKHDLTHWRRLFELYIESRVFFATTEQDHGAHNFTQAKKRFMEFLQKAQQQGLLSKFKKKESPAALQQFLAINTELLQNIRFHEINQTAMDKILKKFDKRTSLGVKATFPNRLPPSMLSEDIAKGLSSQVATQIIAIVPQLDDFLCPICSELAWRPVRLRCQHIYCIRCLIRLQRERKDRCPLCREDVVLEADSTNIDPALINFLKRYFPNEVKAKQKLNNRLATIDEFGENYVDLSCAVM